MAIGKNEFTLHFYLTDVYIYKSAWDALARLHVSWSN